MYNKGNVDAIVEFEKTRIETPRGNNVWGKKKQNKKNIPNPHLIYNASKHLSMICHRLQEGAV